MVPIMFIFILMGAFSVHRDPIDLLVVVGFGILGYFMRRFGYPRPAMILGLVLGDLMEKYLYRSVASYGFSWLSRPAVIGLMILAGLSFVFTIRGRLKTKQKTPGSLVGAMAVPQMKANFAACGPTRKILCLTPSLALPIVYQREGTNACRGTHYSCDHSRC